MAFPQARLTWVAGLGLAVIPAENKRKLCSSVTVLVDVKANQTIPLPSCSARTANHRCAAEHLPYPHPAL